MEGPPVITGHRNFLLYQNRLENTRGRLYHDRAAAFKPPQISFQKSTGKFTVFAFFRTSYLGLFVIGGHIGSAKNNFQRIVRDHQLSARL